MSAPKTKEVRAKEAQGPLFYKEPERPESKIEVVELEEDLVVFGGFFLLEKIERSDEEFKALQEDL